jgi:hypothetical protein
MNLEVTVENQGRLLPGTLIIHQVQLTRLFHVHLTRLRIQGMDKQHQQNRQPEADTLGHPQPPGLFSGWLRPAGSEQVGPYGRIGKQR